MRDLLINVVEKEDVLLMSICFLRVFLVAIFSISLTKFLEMTFQSGMIFRRYYLFLNLMWIRLRKKRKLRMLLKPIGLCSYCYSVWIYFILYLIWNSLDIFIIFGLGINYTILNFINKHTS